MRWCFLFTHMEYGFTRNNLYGVLEKTVLIELVINVVFLAVDSG